ncbi:unnamed protein product, partial [Phaeothamnion confervicola]
MGSDLDQILEGPIGDKLRAYGALMLEDGDKLGLTSLRDLDRIFHELVLDSIAARNWLPEHGKVLDVGSGGGCPGIPLAICREDCKFTLVEANGRKAGFLQRVKTELMLDNVEIINMRSEDLAQQPAHRAMYERVVAKAVAALPTLLELTLPFLKVHCSLIAYKGPSVQQEIEAARYALFELKGKVTRLEPYANGERSMMLCEVAKIAPTPKRYPRRPGMPAKEPL